MPYAKSFTTHLPPADPGLAEKNWSSAAWSRRLARLMPALRVLVVDDEPEMARLVAQSLGIPLARATRRKTATAGKGVSKAAGAGGGRGEGGGRVHVAGTLAEARRVLEKLARSGGEVDLVLLDVKLPDGEGTELLAELAARQPTARALVMSGRGTLQSAIAALRGGAIDYLPKPFDAATLEEHVRRAAARQWLAVRTQRRLLRLRQAVHRLREGRQVVSQKVDLLCNDLVSAYTELAREFEQVRYGEHLRDLLAGAADLEQLLCHTMDWILRQVGNCNIAIFLYDEEGSAELGAYMKYTVPGDERLCGWLRERILPMVAGSNGLLHAGAEAWGQSAPPEVAAAMRGQYVMGVECSYLAEPLGAVLLFRDEGKPFVEKDGQILKLLGPEFSLALTALVHMEQGEGESEPEEAEGDWWERGEDPPF